MRGMESKEMLRKVEDKSNKKKELRKERLKQRMIKYKYEGGSVSEEAKKQKGRNGRNEEKRDRECRREGGRWIDR